MILVVFVGVVALVVVCRMCLTIAVDRASGVDPDFLGWCLLGLSGLAGGLAGGGVVWLVWQLFRLLVRMAE